jgi:hypothetical protein
LASFVFEKIKTSESLQGRQGESQGLSRTSSVLSKNVLSFENRIEGLGLNGEKVLNAIGN